MPCALHTAGCSDLDFPGLPPDLFSLADGMFRGMNVERGRVCPERKSKWSGGESIPELLGAGDGAALREQPPPLTDLWMSRSRGNVGAKGTHAPARTLYPQ